MGIVAYGSETDYQNKCILKGNCYKTNKHFNHFELALMFRSVFLY